MIRLNATRIITTLVLCLLSLGVCAEDNLYVFVFKEGQAQEGITVTVGEDSRTTNLFGLANFALPADEYEVGYYKNGELFALAEINLLENQQSQIFLTLSKHGEQVELDLPLAAYDQNFETQKIEEQQGPKGTLKVKVTSSNDGSPISNARLFLRGYAVEGVTDDNGVSSLELSGGEYDISVVHPKYIMRVMRSVQVKAEQENEHAVALTQSDIVMDEFVVTAPSVEGSLASTLVELKESTSIGDVISSEQFSKAGDSSAASALQRVTGITILNEKFVIVRGLGERYSAVMFNDLQLPSPEPTKRIVPLDIFPTDIIESMDIQKTWSSNQPANFGGGIVEIKSKDIPEEDNFIKAAVGTSYNDSTGDKGVYNPDNDNPLPGMIIGHSNDFGVLTREVVVNSQVIAPGLTQAEKDELNRTMVSYRSYGLKEKKIKPGKDFGLSLGQSFKTSNGIKYGIAGATYYKTKEETFEVDRNLFVRIRSTNEDQHRDALHNKVTDIDERYGGVISLAADNLKGQKLKYTYLHLNQIKDRTNFEVKNRLIEDRVFERTFLQYVEKELTAHQFNGKHHFGKSKGKLFDDIHLDWAWETSSATRLEPGTFEYGYKLLDELVLNEKSLFYLYSDLEDEVDNYRLDFKLPFHFNKRSNHLKFGFFNYKKTRSLDNRRFKILFQDPLNPNANDPSPIDEALSLENVEDGTIDVLDSYRPDDFYTAEQDITAFYIEQLISPVKQLDLIFGVRKEDSTQRLRVGEDNEVFELETSDILPSLAATWRFDEERQLRFVYANTVSRPDFREFSPNRFKDPLSGDIVRGHPDLKYTKITNLDIKFEWYPSFDEWFSVGIFAKDFNNPIETVRTIKDVDVEVSFRNADSAELIGAEFGFRHKLERYWGRLKHFYVSGNYAYIDTEITLDKESDENQFDEFIPNLTSETRPMQGASKYVVNFQLGYDNFFTRRSVVLLYNVFGERIVELGILGNPDIYEQPFHRLDLVIKWGLNDTHDEQRKKIAYDLTFKAKNLLNSEFEEMQGNKVTYRDELGRFYSLSFSMKF